MSKRFLVALTGALSIFGVAAAHAGDTGWYAGANLGSSDYGSLIDDSENGIPSGVPRDNSGTASGWSILGGYQFNKWFGAELGYFDMGSASATIGSGGPVVLNASYKLTGESVDAVFSSSTTGWGVFGKAGFASAHVDEPIQAPGLTADATDTRIILDLGIGASYGMANGWGFRLGYTEYLKAGSSNSNTATGQGNVGFVYLGALYRF